MKVKIYNETKLKEDEIDDYVVRVKALILNSKKEIMLAKSYGTVQFPGGHKENDEDLRETLIREVKEETGILINIDCSPFFGIKYYLRDYPVLGHNRSIEIYYYLIEDDLEFDISKTNLDDVERDGDFKLFYYPLKKVKKLLKKTEKENKINKVIYKEMVLALKEAKREGMKK